MSRLDDLRWLRDVTRESIEVADEEKRAPLIAQMRAVLAELDLLGADAHDSERSGLVDFQAELAKRRQSASSGSGSA